MQSLDFFYKAAKATHQGKEGLYDKWCHGKGINTWEKNEPQPQSHARHKN